MCHDRRIYIEVKSPGFIFSKGSDLLTKLFALIAGVVTPDTTVILITLLFVVLALPGSVIVQFAVQKLRILMT